jgi:hypothetical protein
MRRLIAFLALALVSSSVACSSDSSTNPTVESVVGAWNLTAINGTPLPFLLQTSNPKVELLTDQITFGSSGTFTEAYSLRFTSTTGEVTLEPGVDSGVWTLSGINLSLRYSSDGSLATATMSGDTFAFSGAGFTQTYAKQ